MRTVFARALLSLFALASVSFVSAAHADTIVTYDVFSKFYFSGGKVTGNFTVDLDTNKVLNVDITSANPAGAFSAVFTDASQASYHPGTHTELDFRTTTLNAAGYTDLLEIIIGSALSSTPGTIQFDHNVSPFGVAAYCLGSSYCGIADLDDRTGFVSSATPLPGALPLLASGLAGVGAIAWRRRKKAAASI